MSGFVLSQAKMEEALAKKSGSEEVLTTRGQVRESVNRYGAPPELRRLAGKRVDITTDGSEGRHGSDKTVYMVHIRLVSTNEPWWVLIGLAGLMFDSPTDRQSFERHLATKHPVPLGHSRNPHPVVQPEPTTRSEGVVLESGDGPWLGGMHPSIAQVDHAQR